MHTPNASELLVDEAKEAERLRERLRIRRLADKCETLDQLKQELDDLIEAATSK